MPHIHKQYAYYHNNYLALVLAFALLLLANLFLINIVNAGTDQSSNKNSDKSTDKASNSLRSTFYDKIFQIKVVEKGSNSKVAIGSGFLLTNNDYIVTNYHVISQYVFKPENHSVEYQDNRGNRDQLKLVAFDVINDLALLARHKPSAEPEEMNSEAQDKQALKETAYQAKGFTLAKQLPKRGQPLYALGNPHDYGVKLVEGAYNGLVAHTYNQRILFSGSLNPGMSGGPTIDAEGNIVGVNVATSGSQLSFLIPVSKLQALIARASEPLDKSQFFGEINNQVVDYQQLRISDLLDKKWNLKELVSAYAIGEIRDDIRCWGNRNKEAPKVLHTQISVFCSANDNIYLYSDMSSGQIYYMFQHTSSEELNSLRFHQLVSNISFHPDNQAGEVDVTNFVCQQDHVAIDGTENDTSNSAPMMMAFCSRAYKRMPDLYDVLFVATSTRAQESLVAHFTLAGVTEELGLAFADKFVQQLQWQKNTDGGHYE